MALGYRLNDDDEVSYAASNRFLFLFNSYKRCNLEWATSQVRPLNGLEINPHKIASGSSGSFKLSIKSGSRTVKEIRIQVPGSNEVKIISVNIKPGKTYEHEFTWTSPILTTPQTFTFYALAEDANGLPSSIRSHKVLVTPQKPKVSITPPSDNHFGTTELPYTISGTPITEDGIIENIYVSVNKLPFVAYPNTDRVPNFEATVFINALQEGIQTIEAYCVNHQGTQSESVIEIYTSNAPTVVFLGNIDRLPQQVKGFVEVTSCREVTFAKILADGSTEIVEKIKMCPSEDLFNITQNWAIFNVLIPTPGSYEVCLNGTDCGYINVVNSAPSLTVTTNPSISTNSLDGLSATLGIEVSRAILADPVKEVIIDNGTQSFSVNVPLVPNDMSFILNKVIPISTWGTTTLKVYAKTVNGYVSPTQEVFVNVTSPENRAPMLSSSSSQSYHCAMGNFTPIYLEGFDDEKIVSFSITGPNLGTTITQIGEEIGLGYEEYGYFSWLYKGTFYFYPNRLGTYNLTVVATDDQGIQSPPLSIPVHVYASKFEAVIGAHENTSGNWSALELLGEDEKITCITQVNSGNILYAGTNKGNVFKTHNLGASWDIVYSPGANSTPSSITCIGMASGWVGVNNNVNASICYFGTQDGLAFKTSDGGSSWTGLTLPSNAPSLEPILQLDVTSSGTGYLMTGSRLYVHTGIHTTSSLLTTFYTHNGGSLADVAVHQDINMIALVGNNGWGVKLIYTDGTSTHISIPNGSRNGPVSARLSFSNGYTFLRVLEVEQGDNHEQFVYKLNANTSSLSFTHESTHIGAPIGDNQISFWHLSAVQMYIGSDNLYRLSTGGYTNNLEPCGTNPISLSNLSHLTGIGGKLYMLSDQGFFSKSPDPWERDLTSLNPVFPFPQMREFTFLAAPDNSPLQYGIGLDADLGLVQLTKSLETNKITSYASFYHTAGMEYSSLTLDKTTGTFYVLESPVGVAFGDPCDVNILRITNASTPGAAPLVTNLSDPDEFSTIGETVRGLLGTQKGGLIKALPNGDLVYGESHFYVSQDQGESWNFQNHWSESLHGCFRFCGY